MGSIIIIFDGGNIASDNIVCNKIGSNNSEHNIIPDNIGNNNIVNIIIANNIGTIISATNIGTKSACNVGTSAH